MDTSLLHLDAMILDGYRGPYNGCSQRNPKGSAVSHETLEAERWDSSVTRKIAQEYVRAKEVDWGFDGIAIKTVQRFDDGVMFWRIETQSNIWDVWIEPKRGVYGEC